MVKQGSSRAQAILGYVGANVRRLRSARGWTQVALAEKANSRWRTIQDLERGLGNPGLKLLTAVAEALKVSITDLFAPTRIERRYAGRPEK